MLFKSALAVAATVLSIGLIGGDANAKTRVHFGINIGHPYYSYCDDSLLFSRCDPFGHGFYRPYYRHRNFHPPVHYVHKLSCGEARWSLRKLGYRSLKARDCVGRIYSFTGIRKGRLYNLRLNAVTGGLSRSRI